MLQDQHLARKFPDDTALPFSMYLSPTRLAISYSCSDSQVYECKGKTWLDGTPLGLRCLQRSAHFYLYVVSMPVPTVRQSLMNEIGV